MSQAQREAMSAFESAGAVWVNGRWVWKVDARESEEVAAEVVAWMRDRK